MGDEHSRRPRRKFSDEFKRHAVALVVDTGRPITEVADELGLYGSTLGNWVRQHREREQDG
jgi:transposase